MTRQLFSFFRLSPSLFLFSFSPFTSLSSISPSPLSSCDGIHNYFSNSNGNCQHVIE